MVETALEVRLVVIASLGLFLASTVVFGLLHWVLHLWACSRWRAVRRLGGLDDVHHRFLDTQLRSHRELVGASIRYHVVPEHLTQLSMSLVFLLVLPAPIVLATIGIQAALVADILSRRGMHVKHRPVERPRAYKPMLMCPPEYHALHLRLSERLHQRVPEVVDYVVNVSASAR